MVFLKDIHRTDISGYLGNQLFQILTAYNLARKNNDTLCLPDSFQYLDLFKKPFFNIAPSFYIENQIQNQYDEPHFHYKEIEYKPNLNLNGYYQSWKYFDGLNVRELLEPNSGLKHKILESYNRDCGLTYDELFAYHKVTSVHIRKGDYDNFYNVFTSLCSTNYYEESFLKLHDCTDYYLIFSNDIEFCKSYFQNSGINDKIIFSDSPQEKSQGNGSATFDLYLMSMCNNFIIANSSFSWMGAYLGDSLKKKVIAPKNWFVNDLHDTKDLLPNDWIKL